MEVIGTFNTQRFYDTLALILSQKEKVKITATVQSGKQDQKPEEKTA